MLGKQFADQLKGIASVRVLSCRRIRHTAADSYPLSGETQEAEHPLSGTS